MKSLPAQIVLPILVSLFLNIWGIDWGLPLQWWPDEGHVTGIADDMVDQRTLNPHYFTYGPLHYYELIVFSEIPVRTVVKALKFFEYLQPGPTVTNDRLSTSDQEFGSAQHDPYWIWRIRLARLYSAILGTAIVVLVYLIGELLFGRTSGIIAAWLAALSTGLVMISHIAIVDISQTFWISLAFLFICCLWLKGTPVWSILAGLTVGLAASVKYMGIFAIIPLVLGHLIRKDGRKADLVISLLMVGVGILIGCPVLVFALFEFIDGFTKDLFFNAALSAGHAPSFSPYLIALKDAMGWPLFLCSVSALVYTARFLFSNSERPKLLLLWSAIFPHYVIIGSHHYTGFWYMLPLIPFLAVLTGKMLADLSGCTRPPVRAVLLAGFLVVIGYSAAYAIAADLQLLRDSRVLARQWILQNVPGGSKIEVRGYGAAHRPDLPEKEYVVVNLPLSTWGHLPSVIAGRDQKGVYRFLRNASFALEQYGQKLGVFGNREPYKGWYEIAMDSEARTVPDIDFGVTGLELRKPDYLMLIGVSIAEELRSSRDYPFYDALFSGRTSYREAARFRFQLSPWLDVKIPCCINPDVVIFEKTKRGAEAMT